MRYLAIALALCFATAPVVAAKSPASHKVKAKKNKKAPKGKKQKKAPKHSA